MQHQRLMQRQAYFWLTQQGNKVVPVTGPKTGVHGFIEPRLH